MAKAFSAAAMALAAVGLTTPAAAVPLSQPTATVSHYAPGNVHTEVNAEHHRRWHRGGHGNRNRYDDRRDRYDDRYYQGDRVTRDTRVWRGDDGRYYCRKENGTTGLLIGAGVGALIGNELAGRGDRTLGAILGAAGGALLGRTIDRANARCR